MVPMGPMGSMGPKGPMGPYRALQALYTSFYGLWSAGSAGNTSSEMVPRFLVHVAINLGHVFIDFGVHFRKTCNFTMLHNILTST